MEATCPECGATLAISAEPGAIITCPSCGTTLQVQADTDYWALFAMWLLGIITGVGAMVGAAATSGYVRHVLSALSGR